VEEELKLMLLTWSCSLCVDEDWTGLKRWIQLSWKLIGGGSGGYCGPPSSIASASSAAPVERIAGSHIEGLRLRMSQLCAGVDIKFSGGQPGGWSDGPTLSLRVGDLESVALRALQAPVLPPLHPGRPTEVGLSPWRDRGGWNCDEDQYYEEAVESEEEASDGSWSRTLRVPAQRMSPLRHVSRV